jgi:hypothetical protein
MTRNVKDGTNGGGVILDTGWGKGAFPAYE